MEPSTYTPFMRVVDWPQLNAARSKHRCQVSTVSDFVTSGGKRGIIPAAADECEADKGT